MAFRGGSVFSTPLYAPFSLSVLNLEGLENAWSEDVGKRKTETDSLSSFRKLRSHGGAVVVEVTGWQKWV